MKMRATQKKYKTKTTGSCDKIITSSCSACGAEFEHFESEAKFCCNKKTKTNSNMNNQLPTCGVK
jgi:hypothetical protein